jgi:hypothetical protein
MEPLPCWAMHYMTIIAQGLRYCSKECDIKQILTCGRHSRYLGEIGQLGSRLMPVLSALAVREVNRRKIKLSNRNFFCDLTMVIPRLSFLFNMANAI